MPYDNSPLPALYRQNRYPSTGLALSYDNPAPPECHPALSPPEWTRHLYPAKATAAAFAPGPAPSTDATAKLDAATQTWVRQVAQQLHTSLSGYCRAVGMPPDHEQRYLEMFCSVRPDRLSQITDQPALVELLNGMTSRLNSRMGTRYAHIRLVGDSAPQPAPASSAKSSMAFGAAALGVLGASVLLAMVAPGLRKQELQTPHPWFSDKPLYPNRMERIDQQRHSQGARPYFDAPLHELPGAHVLQEGQAAPLLVPGENYIYAVRPDGRLVIAPARIADASGYGHAELASRGPLAAAGEFKVDKNGVIAHGNNLSGHFATDRRLDVYLDPLDCIFKPPRGHDSMAVAQQAFERIGVASQPGAWNGGWPSGRGQLFILQLCQEELQLRLEAEKRELSRTS